LLFAVIVLAAQTPEWQWAVKAGATSDDLGLDIATDYQGNQYVTGCFYGTATFGPYTLTSSESVNIFAAKLSSGTPVVDELNPPMISFAMSDSPNPFAASTAITVKGDKLEGFPFMS
jgi:hypothetical protein